MLKALCARSHPHTIFAWGDPACIGAWIPAGNVHIIPYVQGGGWKHDLAATAWITRVYAIDIVHYWVSLGPLFHLGMGWTPGVSVCATVHDVGVMEWHDVPHATAVRRSMYWQVQKWLFRRSDRVFCVSAHTKERVSHIWPPMARRCAVVYPPLTGTQYAGEASRSNARGQSRAARKKYFIVLAGPAHKNIMRVVHAFARARGTLTEYRLIILGDSVALQSCASVVDGRRVRQGSMTRYAYYCRHATALVFCSTHEGLGLPPLEAMQHACPLIVSDIPPLRETCADSARFVDPYSVEDIAGAMMEVARRPQYWSRKANAAAARYRHLSRRSADICLDTYAHLGAAMRTTPRSR
jgi:glycosyltransferase involved in cell wall biosynthesis